MPLLRRNKLTNSEDANLEERVMLVKTAGFPIDGVSENQSAVLSVDLDTGSEFNNRLLGVNFGWHVKQFSGTKTGREGYAGGEAKRLIETWAPPEIRWGDGVYANFYDWENDKRESHPDYKGQYAESLTSSVTYGLDSFAELKKDLKFDTIFAWNINYDSPQEGVARLRDHNRKGLNIDRIELGNELFYGAQRADATMSKRKKVDGKFEDLLVLRAREADQIAKRAREHYDALKAADPTLQISVPVSWRTDLQDDRFDSHPNYNAVLAENQDFYDAVSLHRYVRPGDNEAGQREVLDSRRAYLDNAREIRRQFPGKPIWLSEFAVSAGENAITALGLADSYLGFIDNPDLFESAEYFQANGLTPLINFEEKPEEGRPQFTKTTLGATYDTLREVFEDSTLLESDVTSSKLTGSLDSVSAEVSQKDGEVLIYAVNKSPHEANFKLEFDGEAFNGNYEMRTFEFDSIDEFPDFRLQESAFKNPTTGRGANAKLPGLSMSVISIDQTQL
jgi:hypothetical protein